ncbi:LysR family transcriptional regulator [Nocardioides caldifontis]|uniref:LysR family transcriptional regulator n=1 Tax=Nocardioides caldifontis TaxID=2588938 RepID=UPI0011DFD579|nr:LysR family transcriptional regulator [Nocardioides caldifontis]
MVGFDLTRLRMLRELEERGTLAAVATALGYTPSAVSQQLAVLEREAGVALLEKAGRGVRLTDAGRLLSRHAELLLSAAEDARADLASLAGEVRGTVRAGGLQSATKHVLIPAVVRSQVDHPQVRVELTEIELEQALPELRLGALDLVVSDEYDGHPRPRPAGLTFEVLHEEPLRLVLPPANAMARRKGPVSVAALREDVWTASERGTGHLAVVESTCRAMGGFDPDVRHRSNDADVQLELVRRCGAVALLPALALPAADRGLVIRPVAEGSVGRRLVMITREGSKAPALAGFLEAVREQAARLHA